MPTGNRIRRYARPSRAMKSRAASGIQRAWRSRRPRRKVPLALKKHSFVERAVLEKDLTINTEAAAVGIFESFSLLKMRQQADYCAIFEQYRIDKIVATFRYKSTGTPAVDNDYTTNEVNPLLYFKVDHNDITADTLTKMKDSMKTKTHQFSNSNPEFSIQLKPAIQTEAYKSSVTTAYVPKWGQWIPTVDNTVPHYGLKTYACAFTTSSYSPGVIKVSFKYYVSFKNNE